MNQPAEEAQVIRALGDGLVLRRATDADIEAVAAFDASILRSPDATEPNPHIVAWVRDLMRGDHPTTRAGDFTVVEHTPTGRIVSSVVLISQTWTYGGIPFGVGRPELVATHPDFRKRGLIRAQFDAIHQWSAERGELVLGITGIATFYRQFGYEMAVDLDAWRMGYRANVPALAEGEAEPYTFRPATEADLPFFAELYEHGARRSLLACVRDDHAWRYEFTRLVGSGARAEFRVIQTAAGEPVGILTHSPRIWVSTVNTKRYELRPGVSWAAVTPSVIRYLWQTGEAYAQRDGKALDGFVFFLGAEHPAYEVASARLPYTHPPYAWYLRVPDLPRFLNHIRPVLEARLAQSVMAGHTGELKIGFYRSGLRLAFAAGRLTACEAWRPDVAEPPVAFPGLTFLQLLFGYRTVDELRHAFPDCMVSGDEARALLPILFPRQASAIWPLS